MSYAEILSSGMSAGQIFVSTYYGERSYASIRRIMSIVNKYNNYLAIVMCVTSFVIVPYWPAIFAIENQIVGEYAVFAGRAISISYLFSSFVYTYQIYYPIIDKPIYSNVISLLYMLVLPFLICIPLINLFGFKAMSIGFALTPCLTVILIYLYYVIKKKKDIPLFLPESDEIEIHHDLYLVDEDICEVKDIIFNELKKHNIN